jgi:FkbM family methyltransferase
MNPLQQLILAFKENKLEKYDYIDKMQAFNKTLFYFSDRLVSTDIERIEIEDGLILFTTRRDKIKLIFNGVDRRGVPYDILNFGSYEAEDEKILFNLLGDDPVIMDVGANIGWYSLLFSKRRPNAKIFTFEPIEETYKYLITNVTLNAAKNVQCFNIGLAEEEGTSTFYYFPGGSVLASQKNLISSPKAQETICKIEILDKFIQSLKIEKLDLIKCDVEGAELSVIKGGINSIKNFLPIIFMELFERWAAQFNYHPNDVIHLLRNIGYKCFMANGERLEECLEYRESKEERLNFFFLHTEKHVNLIKKFSHI